MLLKDEHSGKKIFIIVSVIIIALVIVGGLFFFNSGRDKIDRSASIITNGPGSDPSFEKPNTETIVRKKIETAEPIFDYNEIEDDDKPLKQIMEARKKALGLDDSLDMIIRSDESFKIGDVHVSMRDILEEAFLDNQDVFVEQIDDQDIVTPQKIKEYGVYVIQPGDNIWNIHFNILKEYYSSRGIRLDPKADEPIEKGLSSGIGKILKFSETMVIIYNLIDKQIEKNIDLLKPLSKIVVYNMDEVFSLLQEINYDNVDQIRFDGKSIWINAEKL